MTTLFPIFGNIGNSVKSLIPLGGEPKTRCAESGSPTAALSEITDYFVDKNFGRPIGIQYGSTSLIIAYEYSTRGYMSHIKNASSGYVYRQVTGMDAFGNITGSSLGVATSSAMGQAQAFHPATGQMMWNLVTKTSNGSKVHELDYSYDGFSNLSSNRVTASNGMQNTESYSYDNLHRLTQSVRSYLSLTRSPDTVNYGFDEIGNILTKSDYTLGTMQYGNAARNAGGNAGPNGVHQVSLIVYNEFSKPTSIAKGSVTSIFSYGANQQRYLHVKSGISGGTQTIYSIDKLLEIEIQGTRTTYRHYFDGVAILNKVVDSSTSWVLGFNLKDRLGSVVTLADETGSVLEHRSYDPFGKPRRGDFVDVAPSTIKDAIGLDPHAPLSADPITDRGFTDHEHLDDQQIIHMNGRVYDYNIGRFTSVDPFIQDPTSSQSINPYSYILNNPLAGTDPSGYSAQDDTPKKDTETKPRDARAEQFKRAQKYSGTASARPAGGGKKYYLRIDVSFSDAGGNGGSRSNNDKARPGRRVGASQNEDGSYQENNAASDNPIIGSQSDQLVDTTAAHGKGSLSAAKQGKNWQQVGKGKTGEVRWTGQDILSDADTDQLIVDNDIAQTKKNEYGYLANTYFICPLGTCTRTLGPMLVVRGTIDAANLGQPRLFTIAVHSHTLNSGAANENFGPGDHLPLIFDIIPYMKSPRGVWNVMEAHNGYLWQRALTGPNAGQSTKWQRTRE